MKTIQQLYKFFSIFSCFLSIGIGATPLLPGKEGAPKADFVVNTIADYWLKSQTLRKVGLEIEFRIPKSVSLMEIARRISSQWSGLIKTYPHHFVTQNHFRLLEVFEFHCRIPNDHALKIQFNLERPSLIPLNGEPIANQGGMTLQFFNSERAPLGVKYPQNSMEAFEIAKTLCRTHLPSPTINSPNFDGYEDSSISSTTLVSIPLVNGQSNTTIYFDKAYLKLPKDITTAGVELEIYNPFEGAIGETLDYLPEPLYKNALTHLNIYLPAEQQLVQLELIRSFENKKAIYQDIQNLVKDESSFYFGKKHGYLTIEDSHLGTLRLMIDGENFELITEPQYPFNEFFHHLSELFEVMQKQGFGGLEVNPKWATGFHVNVEILPQERAQLSFISPMISDWNGHRMDIFTMFQPHPERYQYFGVVPMPGIDNVGGLTYVGHVFSCSGAKYFDVNINHLLNYCKLCRENAGKASVEWPKVQSRSALEYRIYNMDFSNLGKNNMLKAIKFSSAFTTKWATSYVDKKITHP